MYFTVAILIIPDVTQLLFFTFYQVTCMVTCTFLWHFNTVALVVAL